MTRANIRFIVALLGSLLLGTVVSAQDLDYTHFEGRLTHPVRIAFSEDRLLALNTPGARLSVFAIDRAAQKSPMLIAEIPVGLEPVSLAQNPDIPDEVWVVNEVSDSVSIVSLSRQTVIAHLPVPDEPADVAFASGKAFVTCAQSRTLRVFSSTTRELLGELNLECLMPRAMGVSPDGDKVYVAALFSGNRTTILPPSVAPSQPEPWNTELPSPPKTGQIVHDSHEQINYTVIDHDIAQIDVATLQVEHYFEGVGTNVFDLAVVPTRDEIWAVNTEALNTVRFEPELRGHFIDNRVTRIATGDGTATPIDLNPGIDYTLLPNPDALATSIAQPTAVVPSPGGEHLWVAGFGSDRIARVQTSGGPVTARVDVLGDSNRGMRGPRGLALNSDGTVLYVLNQVSNTLATVDTTTLTVVSEVATGSVDPTPETVREGKALLFDARLSGNGTTSCASCHVDADRDGLAWDLGDPGGEMVFVEGENRVNHDLAGNDEPPTTAMRALHPMKGPKVTQTLRGMIIDPETIADVTVAGGVSVKTPSFHWRGDRQTLSEFNATFDKLMGGSELPDATFDKLVTYLKSLKPHPNPYRKLDRSVPEELTGGDPVQGRSNFLNHGLSHCAVCHSLPGGTDHNIDELNNASVVDFVKSPSLLQSYQKQGIFTPQNEHTLSGFGFGHDGTGAALPLPHFYFLSVMDIEQLIDTRAYVLSFDSITAGTAPVVGHTLTVTSDNAKSDDVTATLAIMESRTTPEDAARNQFWNDLVVHGTVESERVSYQFDPADASYIRVGESSVAMTREQLLDALVASSSEDNVLTFVGLPPDHASAYLAPARLREPPSEIVLHYLAETDVVRMEWTSAPGWFVEMAVEGDANAEPPFLIWEPATIGRLSEIAPQRYRFDLTRPPGQTTEPEVLLLRLRSTL